MAIQFWQNWLFQLDEPNLCMGNGWKWLFSCIKNAVNGREAKLRKKFRSTELLIEDTSNSVTCVAVGQVHLQVGCKWRLAVTWITEDVYEATRHCRSLPIWHRIPSSRKVWKELGDRVILRMQLRKESVEIRQHAQQQGRACIVAKLNLPHWVMAHTLAASLWHRRCTAGERVPNELQQVFDCPVQQPSASWGEQLLIFSTCPAEQIDDS